jgi:hypothetical protein
MRRKEQLFKKKNSLEMRVANPNVMDEILKVRKKYPVSANVKLAAFIK